MLLALALGAFTHAYSQDRLFVSPDGNDSWDGTSKTYKGGTVGPKATLIGARTTIRQLRGVGKLSPKGVCVTVAPGRYVMPAGLSLTSLDGGTNKGRMVWRSEVPGKAILDGGLPVSNWVRGVGPQLNKVREDLRANVWVADLSKSGITETGFMSHFASNWDATPTAAELVVNDQAMTLARYPNGRWARQEAVAPDSTNSKPAIVTEIDQARTPAYVGNGEQDFDQDYWVRWAPNHRLFSIWQERVAKISGSTRTLQAVLQGGDMNDPARRALWDPESPGRWVLVNSLFELDTPGEYYIDRNRNFLYYYPLQQEAPTDAVLTMATQPVFGVTSADYVTIQGFTIQNGRQDGVRLSNSMGSQVYGLTVRNCGGYGIRVTQGRAVTVRSCRVTGVGETGVSLSGGDRALLKSSGNQVLNCHIWETGRNNPFYRPGVEILGMGCRVKNNTIHGMDHQAIYFEGNDHRIERNEIYDSVRDALDSAAIYGTRDFTYGGNVIRENLLYNISKRITGYHINHGIYLDDMLSNTIVERNIFRDMEQPIQVGAGHYNIVRFNVMIDCVGGIRIDDRGLQMPAEWFDWPRTLANRVPWQGSPWKRRYPNVFKILTAADYRTPTGNQIKANVFLRCRTDVSKRLWGILEIWGVNQDPKNCTVADNMGTMVSPFRNEPMGDLTAVAGNDLPRRGYRTILQSWVGVQNDTFMRSEDHGYRRTRRP
ncbi:MAG: right-handed parallel beta-helix repeat-containing protein [Fimbriimonadaceae bacterium]|nr:right-handed parallel beta-helix repeat-containing protein [Fimbriimonadaceae bacterium]QYK57015.1 MAG: right-handed parallel beta-helix repeat-containing protein [Fimbriimonadaceae bacterium]